ncbi:MAG: hypothetical protein ACI83B_001209 [Sediminicola sp.]|jgi:hypothetical protein
MKNPIIIKVLSCLVNLLSGLFAAILILYFQYWFGRSDTYSYLFWTIPLSIGIVFFGKSLLNLFPIENKILRLLMILTVAMAISSGWVYGVYLILGPWINAFSIPVFLLWIIGIFFQLVFIDRFIQSVRTKTTISSVLKVVLGFPTILILSVISIYGPSSLGSYLSRPEPETFLIPTNFEDSFKVIYGEECGIMPPTENGPRIIRIPANGILIVKPELESGIIDNEYYLTYLHGKRTKVDQYENYSNGTKKIPGVRLGGSGSMGGLMPDGGFSSESPLAINYTDFQVYQDTIDRYDFKEERKFNSLTTTLVEKCRKLKKTLVKVMRNI